MYSLAFFLSRNDLHNFLPQVSFLLSRWTSVTLSPFPPRSLFVITVFFFFLKALVVVWCVSSYQPTANLPQILLIVQSSTRPLLWQAWVSHVVSRVCPLQPCTVTRSATCFPGSDHSSTTAMCLAHALPLSSLDLTTTPTGMPYLVFLVVGDLSSGCIVLA